MRAPTISAFVSLFLLLAPQARAAENAITCSLDRQPSGEFAGMCHVPCQVVSWAVGVHGPIPGKTCEFPDRNSNIALRDTGDKAIWRGTMEGKYPEDPKLVEVKTGMNGQPGVAKLPFGWFALSGWTVQDSKLSLAIGGDHLLPATKDDFAIIRRAQELVATESTWNRHDTRECPPDANTFSLFCALIKATKEVEGSVHYRQPALQAVREVIDKVGVGRTGKHRLMDYNNHPDTTLHDIQTALTTASDRLKTNFQ